MTPYYQDARAGITLYHGDALEVLRHLPDESVDCCVTSPPYFGLRSYGNYEQQIGLEKTPQQYINRLADVFDESRRVLRNSGNLFVNIGDSYASGKGTCHNPGGNTSSYNVHLKAANVHPLDRGNKSSLAKIGLKPKDLIGTPWMLAFELRNRGWYLRADNIWAKPNCMPSSVRDRTTVSHEHVFHLTKQPRYFYDSEAVRTAPIASSELRLKQDIESQTGSYRANAGAKTNGPMKAVGRTTLTDKQRGHSRQHAGFNERWDRMEKEELISDGGNLRSVWWISPASFEEGHYAVMPEQLAKVCILAGCPEGGTVFDPFSGAGTTALIASRKHRNFLGIELNRDYCDMSIRRWQAEQPTLPIEAAR